MNTKIKLLTASAIVALTFAMPEKTLAMEPQAREEKANGFCLRTNPGITDPNERPTSNPERRYVFVDPYENNNQHESTERSSTNTELMKLELEDSRAWEYAKWVGNGVVQVSYVCKQAAPYLIKGYELMVPEPTGTAWAHSKIFGRSESLKTKDYYVEKMKTAVKASECILEVAANSSLLDK